MPDELSADIARAVQDRIDAKHTTLRTKGLQQAEALRRLRVAIRALQKEIRRANASFGRQGANGDSVSNSRPDRAQSQQPKPSKSRVVGWDAWDDLDGPLHEAAKRTEIVLTRYDMASKRSRRGAPHDDDWRLRDVVLALLAHHGVTINSADHKSKAAGVLFAVLKKSTARRTPIRAVEWRRWLKEYEAMNDAINGVRTHRTSVSDKERTLIG